MILIDIQNNEPPSDIVIHVHHCILLIVTDAIATQHTDLLVYYHKLLPSPKWLKNTLLNQDRGVTTASLLYGAGKSSPLSEPP